jgi:hypothetical protein
MSCIVFGSALLATAPIVITNRSKDTLRLLLDRGPQNTPKEGV